MSQYRNTVTDFVGLATGSASEAATVLSEVSTVTVSRARSERLKERSRGSSRGRDASG